MINRSRKAQKLKNSARGQNLTLSPHRDNLNNITIISQRQENLQKHNHVNPNLVGIVADRPISKDITTIDIKNEVALVG